MMVSSEEIPIGKAFLCYVRSGRPMHTGWRGVGGGGERDSGGKDVQQIRFIHGRDGTVLEEIRKSAGKMERVL